MDLIEALPVSVPPDVTAYEETTVDTPGLEATIFDAVVVTVVLDSHVPCLTYLTRTAAIPSACHPELFYFYVERHKSIQSRTWRLAQHTDNGCV